MKVLLLAAAAVLIALFLPFDWWQKRPSRQRDTRFARWLGKFLDTSLRNLTIRACFLTLMVVLGLWTLPVLLLLFLPLIAIGFLLYSLYGHLFRRGYQSVVPLAGPLLIVAVMWVTTVALLAPVKTLLIAVYFLLGRPAGGALEGFAASGPDTAGLDLLIGSAALAVVLFWLGRDAVWRLRQASQVTNLPTSQARSVALGLVELRGVARSADAEGGPILRLHWDMFDYSPRQELRRFYLEDQSGRVLVDPTECRIRAGWVSDLGGALGCHEIVLQGRVEKDDRVDSVTRTLMPGDPVYLVGNAEINPGAPPDAVDAERLVVRPSSQSSWSLTLWRFLFGRTRPAPGESIFNVFFLADRDEASARRLILRGLYTVCGIGLFWLGSAGVMLSLARRPLSPPPDSWRNLYWRGPEPEPNPDPTVLDMTRNERLFRFQNYLKSPAGRSAAAIPALIEALHYKDQRFRAPAAHALRRLLPQEGAAAQGAIPILIEVLKNGDFHDAQAAMLALGRFGPMAKDAVPSLIALLTEEADDIIRFQAVRTLGHIGPEAKEAVPALQALLQDPRFGGVDGPVPEEVTFGPGIPVRKRTHQAVREALGKITGGVQHDAGGRGRRRSPQIPH